MHPKKIVYLNKKFIPEQEAKISAFSPGFLYGWGIFETMRSFQGKIVYLDAHLKRLEASSKLVDLILPQPKDKLKKIIKEAVEINKIADAYVRLTLWKGQKGADLLVIARKYHPFPARKYREGMHLMVSSSPQNESLFLCRIKTTNRMEYELSYLRAKKKGFDESIILNSRGYLSECTRSNIFFVKDNALFTPSLSCGCLGGITRGVVFDLAKKCRIKLNEGNFTLGDLSEADEAFLTNSLFGIMPIASVDKRSIGKAKCRKLAVFLIERYNCLLR